MLQIFFDLNLIWGERRGLNPRPPEPQPGALPTELRPPSKFYISNLYAHKYTVFHLKIKINLIFGYISPINPQLAWAGHFFIL